MEDDAAEELLVVLAHPERSAHRLATHREDVRQDLVEGRLHRVEVALLAGLRELAATVQLGVVALVVRGLLGHDLLADLLQDRLEAIPDLRIAQGLDLGLEIVCRVDVRLDPLQLAIIRVDEAGQKTEHGG